MPPETTSKYLAGYPSDLAEQAHGMIITGRMGEILRKKYPLAHQVRTDKALYDYVQELKGSYLRNESPLSKVTFDNKLQVIQHALGTHTRISRVQGGKLKAKREIRVAAIFREMPPEFLRMIVVHELAHLKIRDHDKAFYQLCCHMEPAYHQYEFDLRSYLCWLESGGQDLWANPLP